MCTISFVPTGSDRWLLGMNRDERKNRARAHPPSVRQTANGTRYLCPIDPEAGGTWIGINSHGLALLLINNYQAVNPEAAHRKDLQSRGLVIPDLMHHTGLAPALESLKQIDPARYNPFTLFLFSLPEQRIMSFSWDGQQETTSPLHVEPFVKISSGFDPDAAYRIRNEEFLRRYHQASTIDIEWMKQLHQSTRPEPSALSIAMWQDHVMSVSATVLQLSSTEGRMDYCDGWPGNTTTWSDYRLAFQADEQTGP